MMSATSVFDGVFCFIFCVEELGWLVALEDVSFSRRNVRSYDLNLKLKLE